MKFSILVPAYKSHFLRETIKSIISQTYPNWELIIVDDCSPEDLRSIINNFPDKRIVYYRNEKNYGAINVVDNWNKCLSYATGDFVICMGDDDILSPICLEEYKSLILRYPGLGVYHGQTEIVDDKSLFKDVTARRPEFESVYSLIWHRWDNRHRQFIGDFLFDKKKLQDHGGFVKIPLAWGSDDLTAVMMASLGGIANTSNVVFYYRESSLTISSSGSIDIKMEALKFEERWYESFLVKIPDNESDIKFRESILRTKSIYYKRRYMWLVSDYMKQHRISGLFHWRFYEKRYKISWLMIAYAWLAAIK